MQHYLQIAKLWKHPKYPFTDERIRNSAIKNEIFPLAANKADEAREYNAKQNKSEKDKYHMISLMWSLRNKTNEQRRKKKEKQTKKQTLNYREQTDGYQRGDG